MLPNQAPPSRMQKDDFNRMISRGTLNSVVSRNIFSYDPKIPDPLHIKNASEKKKEELELPPVASQLPLNLMGTIVHSTPEKSIANLEVTPKNTVIPFRINQEIENMGTMIKIERGKIFLRNNSTGRMEFIELKEKSKLNFSGSKPVVPSAGRASEIKPVGQNKFEVSRAEIMKQTADLPAFLNTAAMQPRKKPNGEIDGFKFLAIQPGSPISQLGFQVGDVIKSVNGEPVTDPAKAMELYQAMKTSNNVKLMIERNGKDEEFDYNVK